MINSLAKYILICMVLSFTNIANAIDINVGITGKQPPFNYTSKDGIIYGFDADIAKLVCHDLELHCTIKQLEKNQLSQSLENGAVDIVISSVSYNDMSYGLNISHPYFVNSYSVIKQKTDDISDIQGLRGKTIAALKENANADMKLKFILKNDVNFTYYDDYSPILRGLIDGSIDYAMGNTVEMGRWMATRSICCEIIDQIPNTIEDISIYTADNPDIKSTEINTVLDRFIESGNFAVLSRKHFGYILPTESNITK